MSVWVLCVLLFSLIHLTKQDEHLSPVRNLTVYAEETDISNYGVWVLNVAWRDTFVENNTELDTFTYDIEVFLTEQTTGIHYETIQVKPDLTNHHQWKWTSPFPLQCTSISVKLSRRDQHHTGNWSQLSTYKGKDVIISALETTVYPHDHYFLFGSNITFCCILKAEKAASFNSSQFTKRISNRTYITDPVHFHSQLGGINLNCGKETGTTVFIGYPPDDQNLTCVTRNLSSVECYWDQGRATHIEGERGETEYTLNGRRCQLGQCVLPTITVKNWTLTAKNPLGVKIISDTADPLHRVCLRAPRDISGAVYERNATLTWRWDVKNYSSFSMICQVELNGHIYKKTFSGIGLTTIVLVDLQPFAEYTAKVQCGSSEHFYVWGDWSHIRFKMKEDIPEAVDVWMQYVKQNTLILWKFSNKQSHGMLTGYELTVSDSKNKSSSIHVDPNTTCYSISAGNKTKVQKISVSAKNSAGLSPPVSIIIPSLPGSRDNESQIKGKNGSFEIFWKESSSSSCGYVVDWFPTYSKQQCAVEWKKVPSGHLSTRIQSDFFQSGVRYTVSVYSCTGGAPHLLQRREGYAIEQPPFGPVQNLTGKRNGKNLVLSWKEVPLDMQGGFIQGYRVIAFKSDVDSKTPIYTTTTKETTVDLTLDPGPYTINIAAFTSAGNGVYATFGTHIEISTDEMITATVLGSSVAAVVFFIITFLCYRKRMWVKKMLYPVIPEPKVSGQWATKGIYCSQMTEAYMKCEIQEVHGIDQSVTSQESALIRSNSILCPADDLYQNNSEFPLVSRFPPETTLITFVPLSSWRCAEKLTSVVENPTYNMTWPESVNVSQISELTLEMDDSYLPAPNVVCSNFHNKDSGHYKPQTLLSN